MQLYWSKKFRELWHSREHNPLKVCMEFLEYCEREERKLNDRWQEKVLQNKKLSEKEWTRFKQWVRATKEEIDRMSAEIEGEEHE